MKYLVPLIFTLFFAFGSSQISGNQVYGNSYGQNISMANFVSTDSTVTIHTSILMNTVADGYMITMGVAEEGTTSKESLQKINQRISGFLKKLQGIGVKENEVFVDFISQVKIYDFSLNSSKNTATQYLKGFETKKNIIVKIWQKKQIEEIITLAAEFEIYDIINVEYIQLNREKIYQDMFKEAHSVLQQKKKWLLEKYPISLADPARISDQFVVIPPKNQYEKYSSSESSNVEQYGDAKQMKVIERKSTSYYFDARNEGGYDKVIHPQQTEVGTQYVLKVQAVFNIKK